MKIRIEISSLATQHRSGVAQYTQLLTEALNTTDTQIYGHYFDFLDRQPKPRFNVSPYRIESNKFIPLRVYAKAQSLNLALPFDLLLPKVDLTIFPNFATWPTIRSRYTATVVHDLTYLYFPDLVEEKNLDHLRRVVPRSITGADFIITVSESVKSELIKEFKLPVDKCIVTPIPPDETFFTVIDKSSIQTVKEKYGITKKYIYFIGNLEPRKNLKTLIEAYELLPIEIRQTYSLILAGGKGWKTESTQKALQQAIEKGADIKHVGFIDQEDSPALFQGASLFVMPSLYEGFGMPILEAMASGTPVVASDIPVLREVGAAYATYADPHDPKNFSVAICDSLNSPSLKREELQKNVRRYSWNKNTAMILDTYRSLQAK